MSIVLYLVAALNFFSAFINFAAGQPLNFFVGLFNLSAAFYAIYVARL